MVVVVVVVVVVVIVVVVVVVFVVVVVVVVGNGKLLFPGALPLAQPGSADIFLGVYF
jgi:hypothetical protein